MKSDERVILKELAKTKHIINTVDDSLFHVIYRERQRVLEWFLSDDNKELD